MGFLVVTGVRIVAVLMLKEVVGETVQDLVVEHVRGQMSGALVGEEGSPSSLLKSKCSKCLCGHLVQRNISAPGDRSV